MFSKPIIVSLFLALLGQASAAAQEATPKELDVLKSYVGVWDAAFEVWPGGPDKPSMTFKGVETNRAYGTHWISSDLDCEMGGKMVKVHSIVGYDLDRKMLVGTVIDDGPYSASLTGEYDEKSTTVHWTTQAKDPDGKPLVQKTSMTQTSADERLLVLKVPDGQSGKFKKFMQIKFVRRK